MIRAEPGTPTSSHYPKIKFQSQPHELRVGVVVGIRQVFQAISSSWPLAEASRKVVPSFDHAAPPVCDELRVNTYLFEAIAESSHVRDGNPDLWSLISSKGFHPGMQRAYSSMSLAILPDHRLKVILVCQQYTEGDVPLLLRPQLRPPIH
jgi:hypothetical protein